MKRAVIQRALLAFLGVASTLTLGACGGSSSASTSHESQTSGSGFSNVAPTTLTIQRGIDVLHAGDRLVTSIDPLKPAGQGGTVQFIERISSDGAGRFAIDPLDAAQPDQPPAMSWPLFSILQDRRQAFHARFRDFEIRDAIAFRNEWSFRNLGVPSIVAGRQCHRVNVTHLRTQRTFELSIDDETELVLDQRELDSAGNVLFQVTYQTLELNPDLSNVDWHDDMPASQFALDADLEEALGFDVRIPTNPPPGYVLHDITSIDSSLAGDQLGPWLRVTFTNGVEPLFYALSIPSGLAADPDTGSQTMDPTSPGNTMRVLSLGRASAAVGDLPHGAVMSVGRVGPEELLDLIHSAIPE